ncbi:MAG: reverse transcriptase domain-containing protein, partial [bacterium]
IRLVLAHIGFPALQADILLSILDNSVAQVMVNGFLTGEIPLLSGVRQGCPLSPLLFILVIECLNRALYNDSEALGIVIAPGIELRGLFFADDIALLART